ncbi:PadR family transcriptional regulator [Cytobacillus sp. Hm23]
MTRLMVLGMLRMKPMSGYEIQQVLQISQTDAWAGVLPGSIYHALKKMEKEELVEIASLEQTGNRTKAIYKITDKGHNEFQRLLIESFASSSVILPTTLYTGLIFAESSANKQVIRAIDEQKELLTKQLSALKEGEEHKKKAMDELSPLTKATFESIYSQYELQLTFLDKIQDILQHDVEK